MTWWQRLLHKKKMDDQLEKELRFHLEQHTNDLIAQGLEPIEARRQARLTLGGPAQVKEECRDARGTRWFDDLVQDFRYAVRTLRNRPGFAAVALLTLALGTGATTVMFTVINGVLLKPMPYADPDGLVRVQEKTDFSTQFGNLWGLTYPNYVDVKRESHSLDMAAWALGGGTVNERGPAEYVTGREISAELFSILGTKLFRGRAFLPEEDRPGATPVAIIGYSLWQRRFAGKPAAIGMTLVFNGKSYMVTGIMPPEFRLDGEEFDLFTPLGQDTGRAMQNRSVHRLIVWARLRPGAKLATAQAELTLVGRQLAEQFPASNKGRTFIAETLRPDVDDVRSTLWLLLGAVGLVLLIACVNVASLLLARAVSRERELAMRVALGAGRGRLVRQCLTESAVLGVSGGLLGVLLAAIGIHPFVKFWPGSLPRAEEVQLDWRVLLFAITASLLCGLLFGLAPALRATARELEQALRAGARTLAASSRRLHSAFVVSEVVLAMVLLVGAGMLGRTLLLLSSLDPGIKFQNVLTARMALSSATLANAGETRTAWADVMDRIHHVPGVQAVATVDTVPMRDGNNPIPYGLTAAPADEKTPLALANSVSPEYLKVMGIRLLEGRFFDDQDRVGNESVVVIDDVMAHEAFPGQEPIGKHVWIGLGPEPSRVVGVVGHVRYWGLAGDDKAKIRAQLYYPFAQVPDALMARWSQLMSISIRTSIAPMSMIETLQREVRGAKNDQVLYEIRTLEQLVKDSLARQRFLLLLLGMFAGLALLLACIGIYGVLAYLTSQRVPEIGLRMALGASAGGVMWMVLRQSLGMIAAGIGLGIWAALAAGRVLERLVVGVRPTEPATFVLTVSVLVIAALIASFVPARRASRVDPVTTLRQE
jgi:predicted permease